MPKYNYKCKCGNEEVVEKRMKEASRQELCSKCSSIMSRVYNPTPNKWNCSGAYVTDNR